MPKNDGGVLPNGRVRLLAPDWPTHQVVRSGEHYDVNDAGELCLNGEVGVWPWHVDDLLRREGVTRPDGSKTASAPPPPSVPAPASSAPEP